MKQDSKIVQQGCIQSKLVSNNKKTRDSTVKVTSKTKDKKNETVSFGNLLTGDLMEQWYLCQANFILPLLVLLPNPAIFLVVVLLYNTFGIVIAFRKK
jgi:hypothetical protein